MPAPLYRPAAHTSVRRRRPWGALAVAPIGGLPLPPVLIPYEWVSMPLTRRPTPVINSAAVTQDNGITAYSTSQSSIDRYGVGPGTVRLDTATDADAAAYAAHLTTYYASPRPRQPILRLNLYGRTDAEALLILSVGLTRRVRITGAPATWPPGAANFTLAGRRDVIAVDQRYVDWSTAALIGQPSQTILAADSYARIVVDEWGIATTGQAWSNDIPNADLDVNGTAGTVNPSILAENYNMWVDVGSTDVDTRGDISIAALPASGTLRFGAGGRVVDGDNCYRADATVTTTGATTLQITKADAGVETSLASVAFGTVVAGAAYAIELKATGGLLQARMWPTSGPQAGWQLTATDTLPLTAGTSASVFCRNDTASAAHVFTVRNFSAAVDNTGGAANPGPWSRWDSSSWGSSDLRPF